MIGSVALTSNKNEVTRRETAIEPTTPSPHPISANFAPEVRTSRAMPRRCAPSAMRIAISWVRKDTENATTA